ncbi:MAG: putative 2OG-Fe(II) oxygenase [Xanthomonadales bacterium]|nr:putative 2OG-Fe(II) oxygenase [Xanthomonadales bacterium]
MHANTPYLTQARHAWRSGALAAAQDLYRRHLAAQPQDLAACQELAGVLFAQQRFHDAERVLDEALTLADMPALRFNRALVRRQLGRGKQVLEDLEAVLAQEPSHLPARLHRGSIRFHQGDPTGALADFQQVAEQAPDQIEGHFNAALSQLRLGRNDEALANLERALAIAPEQPAILRAMANALRMAGRPEESLPYIRKSLALDERSAISNADHGLCLLAADQADEAINAFRRSLELDARDQTAIAGLYLAYNEAGNGPVVNYLFNIAFTQHLRLELDDPEGLRAAVLAHPELKWEPSGKTTRQGEQTAFLDLSPGSPFAPFGDTVKTLISRRLTELTGADADVEHPWLRGLMDRWHLNMWATVLHEGGHQEPHIHPGGWMSGVFYLDDGGASEEQGGAILFGKGPEELQLKVPFNETRHQPQTGDLLLFPSYFYHRTVPFKGPGTRISLAFDMVPAVPPERSTPSGQ